VPYGHRVTIRWIRSTAARHAVLLSRRQFLGVSAALWAGCKRPAPAGSGDAATPSASPAPAAPSAPPAARASLSAEEWTLLAAISERILPSNEGPGAREAGVIDFIDRQLATPAVHPLAEAVHQFAASMFDWEKRRGTRFSALPEAEQDRALTALAAGKLDLDFDSQAAVFEFLHSLTLEGFLSDPAYGGNRGGIGWRAIGFASPAGAHHHQPAKGG
jgi:gluconate 2-dehydrogenase gamma chain